MNPATHLRAWICVMTALTAPRVTLAAPAPPTPQPKTSLTIEGAKFTINDRPAFLLGFSYYAALGAPEDFVRKDLDDLQRLGFNWLRVWATWDGFDHNISAFDNKGKPREPFFKKLAWLVGECDARGLVVDVTLNRRQSENPQDAGGMLPNARAHRQAVETLVEKLKPHRNWFLDLANERDVGDARFVDSDELKSLRELVRELDPGRLVTASFGGHDLSQKDIRDALNNIGLDFLTPHRPRTPESPSQTAAHTASCLAIMKNLGQTAPILYQEPFRRGYTQWAPTAEDFLADLRGAKTSGAAGWCFHNGSQRNTDEQPRRSFDLRSKRLMDQLDGEELKFIRQTKD